MFPAGSSIFPLMHPRATLLALSLAIVAAACGSSSTTSTAPATVPRCGVTLATTDLTVPASGGTGRIAITTARECAWTANSNAAWLTVTGPSSGQGDGVIEYSASSNNDPTTRRALIELNDQKANVTQAGAACTMALGDTSESFSPAGGSGTIPVQASSPSCPWTAVSDSNWITIRSGASGSGNGTVAYDVAAGSGPPRTGTILAAGLRFAITQSEGCTFAIGANSYSPGPSGGATTIPVSAAAGCPWTAISNVPWITVPQGAAGSGAGAARLLVESTSGPPRTGTVLVAGQTVTVTQGGGCDFVVAPLVQPVASNGGSGSATIEAGGGCGWTATSNAPWITLTGPTSGTGGGAITFTVAPLTGAARSGTITAAGVTITVSQGSGCTFAIAPTSVSLPASGGGGTVSVTAGADCAWTATSGVSWLSIAGGASGTGNGTVQFTAAATTGGPRSGTLTIGGQPFTVNQDNGCSVSIAPTNASVAPAGGTGSIAVAASAGCAWTAATDAPWITIASGASGNGNGTVQYNAAATTGGSRSGTITIGGQAFTLTQGSGCAFSIATTTASVPAGGGTGSVPVTSAAGCAWTATSNAAWLTITSGASGSGNGTVAYSAAATTGGPRSAALIIAGQTFTVTQGSGCSFGLAPASLTIPAAGGSSNVNVTAGAGCAWTASSATDWLTIASGANGSGEGTVRVTAAANTGVARSGTITIAGQTYTVNQPGGCSFTAAPTTITVNALGGNSNVGVTAPAGCTWTASSGVNWVTVASGSSGSGNGTTTLSVGVNLGSSRSGTATVAGQTITINQPATLCQWSIKPTSAGAKGNGDDGTVAVTAGAGCPWTATSDVSWITVTSGASGSGNGTVAYTVARNTTNTARTGTITIAGETFTVNQAK